MSEEREIWWCEEHEAPWVAYKDAPGDPEDACFYWYWRVDATDGSEIPEFLCRLVPARLLINPPTEEE